MSAIKKLSRISVEDYLAGELVSPIKHEYLNGVVYAMAGARNAHNRIATNSLGALVNRLRGQKCEAFNSDTKIRIRFANEIRFYYPDAFVVCDPNPDTDSFHDRPKMVLEVLSRSTRRIDEGEKKDAYLTIPSLDVYVLLEQESATVTVFRRSKGFVQEVYEGLETVMRLPEIGIELPLAEIYDRVEFSPEAEPEEEFR
jgi:Uma2 family endonuclease